MRRNGSVVILLLLGSVLSVAQLSMKDVFLKMPLSLVPELTENSKLDFIDFMESNMKAEVHNELGGKSELLALTDQSLSLRVSEALRIDMRLLPVEEEQDSAKLIVAVLSTYGTTRQETEISLYSVLWRPLPLSDYLPPVEGCFTAAFIESPQLGISLSESPSWNPRAMEEQSEELKRQKVVNWSGKILKKY